MIKPQFKTIYLQKKIAEKAEWRDRTAVILRQFPDAEKIEVDSHQAIPSVVDAAPEEWMQSKRNILILGVRSTFRQEENGRSADYIAASYSNGCLSACQYCYVARRKGTSNPLTIFVNIEEIANAIERHQKKLGPKLIANQCDHQYWTYDIGCNGDLSLDATVCTNPQYLITRFATMEHAKATFATKTVNHDAWLSVDPKGRTRIRYSLMPHAIAKRVDIATSPIWERLASANVLVEAGYEVHFNFSPIILYEGWQKDWEELFAEIDGTCSLQTKKQLACEAFFLTHSPALHEINEQWNPTGEAYLWNPSLQIPKPTKPDLVVYHPGVRKKAHRWFEETLQQMLPYCPIRYMF